MSTDGWKNFGEYGADRDPGNVHGNVALGRALENALERLIIDGGIKSPASTRRGLVARMRYLTTTQGGYQALAEAGITATRPTIRAWTRGTQHPRPENQEAIDTAYWNLRAANLRFNPGAFKQHLNRGGRGTQVEIHPIDQSLVDDNARRDNLEGRRVQVHYVWDAAVDAMFAADLAELERIWDDIIAELDSDWGAYTYVSSIGLGA
ncbi:hypothetical protein [Streptacidiphilus sp. EB103A]|uniref:hypothetical protein n=1 Tax=Streptacidiphilus sp. EB103A TaxID=3156275 RepID=UPI0035155266